MAQTNWQNLPSTSTPLNATNLNKIETAVYGTVLYSNTTGSTSNITLLESVEDYDYVEVYYHRADNDYGSIKIDNPNNKMANIMTSFIYGGGTGIQIGSKRILFKDDLLRTVYEYHTNINASGIAEFGAQTQILIYKVIGYKA